MSQLVLQRFLALARVSVQATPRLARAYSVAPAKPAWSPRVYSKPDAAPIAKASTITTSGNSTGNPEIIEDLPNTAAEANLTQSPPLPSLDPSADSQNGGATDWSKSYHGLSSQAFSKDIAEILLAPIDPLDIEMKPGMCCPRPHPASFTHSASYYRRSHIPA